MDKVIVVSAHPDDETLGAGGSLLKHKHLGDKIYWLNITNMKEEFGFSKDDVERRMLEIKQVKKDYQFDELFDLGLKPVGIDRLPMSDIVQKISGVFTKVSPTVVILPFRHDIHSDHRIVFNAAYACTKTFRYPSIKKILMMEITSETNFSPCDSCFSPNYFVDISGYLERKIEIMQMYKGELEKHPFPRSAEYIKALATVRGAQAGSKYAEAFTMLKEIC